MCDHYTDAKQILFKSEENEFSPLTNLNITKGAPLDYIIEVLGKAILDIGFIRNPILSSNPELDSIQKIITNIYSILSAQQGIISNLQQTVSILQDKLNTKYNLTDTNGIGIEQNSTLTEILQTIINNTYES